MKRRKNSIRIRALGIHKALDNILFVAIIIWQ
jgi:hypothetical protein